MSMGYYDNETGEFAVMGDDEYRQLVDDRADEIRAALSTDEARLRWAASHFRTSYYNLLHGEGRMFPRLRMQVEKDAAIQVAYEYSRTFNL